MTIKGQLNAMYHVEASNGGKDRWIRIGTAFPATSGKAYNLFLDAIPINFNGQITLSSPFDENNERKDVK